MLYPIYRQDTSELKRVMSQAISLFGVPRLLVTDRGRMFESTDFVQWISELGSDLHYITPEMHGANGQVERYIRTVLNMLRIEVGHKNASWSTTLWKLQLVLNISKQKTTQSSAINLMIGTDASTPAIRSLIRDLATSTPDTNREALREMRRSRASELMKKNQEQQDASANQFRRPPREYKVDDLVFVIKYSQSTGKLDPGMRGPYRVTKVLPNGRYELKLLSGSCGKTTQAASQYMVPWKGEWCPESCAAFFENDDTDEAENRLDHLEGDNPAPASIGLSMPSLDEEVGTEQHPSAGASQEVQVEDDLLSGEAVLGVKE
ncbi:uncharacterized protein LOC126912826 [Spodoptera frugiperda]|uniref:Uncharacterized protein LOC126912826 n=1 Tax=Spodoptera frugiperda TaxID=7108 RepID=A0A9R0EBM2_SPOFR|nr:uncharacterized protein LOC126912826 [Spodoptera frugiperda]